MKMEVEGKSNPIYLNSVLSSSLVSQVKGLYRYLLSLQCQRIEQDINFIKIL